MYVSVCMHAWMDGWMDGWIHVRMYVRIVSMKLASYVCMHVYHSFSIFPRWSPASLLHSLVSCCLFCRWPPLPSLLSSHTLQSKHNRYMDFYILGLACQVPQDIIDMQWLHPTRSWHGDLCLRTSVNLMHGRIGGT